MQQKLDYYSQKKIFGRTVNLSKEEDSSIMEVAHLYGHREAE